MKSPYLSHTKRMGLLPKEKKAAKPKVIKPKAVRRKGKSKDKKILRKVWRKLI